MIGVGVRPHRDLRAFELEIEGRLTSGISFEMFGISATAALEASDRIQWIPPLASCATLSTRRTGSTEKFWIVSPKILPLPTMVITLSGVTRVVPNRAQFVDRADDARDADEIADLERPQDQHERAGREVAQQPAPGRTDGRACTGQQRGEQVVSIPK